MPSESVAVTAITYNFKPILVPIRELASALWMEKVGTNFKMTPSI